MMRSARSPHAKVVLSSSAYLSKSFTSRACRRHAKRRETCLVLAYPSSAPIRQLARLRLPDLFFLYGGLTYWLRQGSSQFGRHSLDHAAFLRDELHILGHGWNGGRGGKFRRSYRGQSWTACFLLSATVQHSPTHSSSVVPSLLLPTPADGKDSLWGGGMSSWDLPRVCFCISPPSSHLCLHQYHRMCAH
ncbi:hypothetical protein GE21DRAFT_1043759 [Neurospora crassa]|nr:hypothetical protein GE21DRAFT_1043759 [Neurospora crassa]